MAASERRAPRGLRATEEPASTPTSTRVIPADSWILEQLAAHLQRCGTGADGVVIHYQGRPMDAAKFGHYVRMARKRAGLPRTVSFHDLRHFYASSLDQPGCSVKQVQLAVGHKSARVTLDVYGHLWPGEEAPVRDAIGRVFRPTADSSRTSPTLR